MAHSKRLIFSMSLLMAGTALGAGILGLPIVIGLAGFIPGIIVMILCWVTLALTGWIFIKKLDAANYPIQDFVDLYKREFGSWSIWLSAIGYFITFYGVITAYLCGISSTLIAIFPILGDVPYMSKILIVIFFILLTGIVLFGIDFYKKLNSIFSVCLFVVFFIMVFLILFHIKADNLEHANFSYVPYTLPILFTSFCFHPVIPLICRHVKEMRHGIKTMYAILFLGTFIVLVIIFFWTLVVLGVVPIYSEHGMSLIKANQLNLPATVPLAKVLEKNTINLIALFFTFFAIITSYIGSGAGLMSFVKNLSSHCFKKRNRVTDALGTFAIPFLVALIYPDIFLNMLGVVGGFGIVIIYGFMPAFLALKPNNSKGMKILGGIVFLISAAVFIIEIIQLVSSH